MGKRKLFRIKSTRKRILNDITNLVYLYAYPDEIDCPDCVYDSVSGESADVNCATCNGVGKVLGTAKITCIRGSLRCLTGESIIRRELGNVKSDVYLLYCDIAYIDSIKSAKYIKSQENYYQSWLDDTGNPIIRSIRTMDEFDRIEVTLKRREGEDS